MDRKAKPVRTTREAGEIYTSDPLALNQWCIEMAIRWPTFEDIIYGQAGLYQQAVGGLGVQHERKVRTDADIIGRANRIMDWVKKHH